MPKQEFDKQGKYFWHLVKTAGWDGTRVSALLVKHYACTHWNVLTPAQKRGAINLMSRYADKNRVNQNKKLRSTIMSLVARNGHTKDWLYDALEITAERTLSKMDYPELVEIYKTVKVMFPHKVSGVRGQGSVGKNQQRVKE